MLASGSSHAPTPHPRKNGPMMPSVATSSDDRPDLHHLRDGRLEADLKQQEDDAEARQHVDRFAGLRVFESGEARQHEVADDHASQQLAEHRRLAELGRKMPAQLRRHDDQGQRDEQRGNRIDHFSGALR